MKKLALLMAAMMVLSMGLAACGSKPAASAASGAAGASEATAVSGPKEITVNLGQEPPQLNSITTTSTGSMNVLRHVMDGLVMLDQKDVPVPAIAEKWDVSDDQLTYTFHLRKDAKWSNGDPVVAKDFVFAWNQLFTAASGAPYGPVWAGYIKGATEMFAEGTPAEGVGYKAIDDNTLELVLVRPCTYILSVLAFPNFYPVNEKAYNEMGGLDSYATEAEKLCTNGSYKIESWAHEDELVLAKNADYFDAANIKLDKITMKMINDSTTSYNGYVAGDLDMIALNGEKSEMARNDGYKVQSYDDGGSWYLEYNTKIKGLDNAKIRKAITMAIDAESFIKNVVKNSSTVAYSFTPNAIVGGKFTEATGKLLDREGFAADDYAKTKALFAEGLKEAGITAADMKISVVADDTDTAASYAAFIQEQLKTHLGLEVAVEQMTYKARLAQMESKSFNGITFAGWGPDYNDPMTFMDLWTDVNANNHTSWNNAEYNQLIIDATNEADAAKRQEILINAEKLLMEELPISPIYNRVTDYVTSERLTGVVRTAFDDMNFRWADVVA